MALAVERPDLQPAVVGTEADRPDDRGDVGGGEIEFGRLGLRTPHRHVAVLGGRTNALALDVRVDVVLDALGHPIGSVERRFEGRGELQDAVLHAQQTAVQLHALGRERAQVDVSTTVTAGDVVVRVLAFADATGLIFDGDIVDAHVVQPGDTVTPPIEACDARCGAGDQVNPAAVEMQILGDLRSGLAGADDQYVAVRELVRAAVFGRVDLDDVAGKLLGEAGNGGDVVTADGNDDLIGVHGAGGGL